MFNQHASYFVNVLCESLLQLITKWSYSCRLIKDFDREIKDEETKSSPEVHKQLNDEKQSMVSSLLFYLSNLGHECI